MMLPQWILAILLHLIPVLCLDDPFLDESEANNFLRRSRRNNRENFIIEEIWAGNQERECIEESCGYEEAREVFEDRVKTDEFWQKYRRCKRAPSFNRNKYSTRQRAREAKNEALRNCISDTDQCTPFPCVRSNTVKCMDAINNYKCECKPGYAGRRCESPVNECASNPCHGSARCEDEIGGFRCVCDSLHEGILCENEINDCRNVASKRCSSAHGRCLSAGGGAPFRCVCHTGYTGTRCEEDIDECADSSSCDQTCTNTVGSFVCSCGVGFILDTRTTTTCKDIDECADDLHGCEHFCHNSGGTFRCSCEPGFQLDDVFKRYCEDIDECSVDNGGCSVIEGGCGLNRGPCETCHNTDGAFTCYCPPGFTPYVSGQNCEDIDECQDDDHDCQHECDNFPGGYRCLCNEGYKLNFNKKTCSDVNECLGDNGCETRCVNSAGSYTCTCNRGFKLGEDGRSCVDNDECAGGDTRCDQQCVNTEGSYECACRTGYRLVGRYRCSELKKHCASSPCGRNGRCHDVVNSFTCECRHGFSGDRCEIDENPCLSNPCLNGGTCERNEEGFTCRCTDDYDGDTCQIEVITCADGYALQDEQCVDVDECLEEGLCQHECENTEGSFSCLCNGGYSVNGNQCDDIDECVDGPCEQMCTNIPGSYSCSCNDGYVSRGDGGGCEKTYTCFDHTPRMLSEPHLLLGTKKNDFLSFEIDALENIFILEFEYRTLDPDALLLAMSDRTSQRYIFVALENGLLSVTANLDDSHTERSETPSPGAKLDAQWHTVLIKKRKNRIRVSKDGKKLRDLRFSRDDFGSVNMLYYGGLPLDASVDTDSNLQQYGDKRFQGCLRKMSHTGMRVTLANDPSPEDHIGCFDKIGSGMFFNGTGEISVAIPEESTLRMRFNFKSRVPRGAIALIESRGGDEFSLKIEGNQLTAEMTTNAGQRYSSAYTAENVEALCNDLWHICDVTVSPTRIRLHVDGLEAQEQNFDGMAGIRFGENAILHLGGRSDPSSNYFAGSLRNFELNNRPLDLSDPLELSGVFAYTIPLP